MIVLCCHATFGDKQNSRSHVMTMLIPAVELDIVPKESYGLGMNGIILKSMGKVVINTTNGP